jgi:hypothetical protein
LLKTRLARARRNRVKDRESPEGGARIDYDHDIVARLDPRDGEEDESPPLEAPPPALSLGVKPAENEPPRTDFARVTY